MEKKRGERNKKKEKERKTGIPLNFLAQGRDDQKREKKEEGKKGKKKKKKKGQYELHALPAIAFRKRSKAEKGGAGKGGGD